MLTRKGALLAVALVLLAAAAVLFGSWPLALAGLPLLAALLWALVREGLGEPRIEARQEVARTRLLARDVVPAHVAVASRGAGLALCEIAPDLPSSAIAAGGSGVALARLGEGRAVDLDFDLAVPVRGRLALADVVVAERGPLGLARRVARASAPFRFDVYPAWEELRALPAFARRHRFVVGAFASGRAGAGQEFYGLRAYLPGDPMDSVNWRQTAKHGRPIVNEVEHENPADLVLVLDARARSNVGAGYTSTLEAGIRAVVTLSERAVRDRYKIGLVVVGDGVDWVHPASGRRQHERIVERLLDAKAAGDAALASVLPALPPALLPGGAQVVIVTPTHVDATLPETVLALRSRNLRVLLLVPVPEKAEAASGVGSVFAEPVARVLPLARRRFYELVRASGGEIVEWDVRDPLSTVLVPMEGRRP